MIDLRGRVRIILENLSVMTSRKLFPRFVVKSGPRMSVATNSREPLAAKKGNRFALLRSSTWFCGRTPSRIKRLHSSPPRLQARSDCCGVSDIPSFLLSVHQSSGSAKDVVLEIVESKGSPVEDSFPPCKRGILHRLTETDVATHN